MYAELFQLYFVVVCVKPLLMPILLVIFALNAEEHFPRERTVMEVALVCSFLGDVLLLQPTGDRFLFGLVAFLITHISYMVLFSVRLREEGDALKQRLTLTKALTAAIPFLFYILVVLYIFCPRLSNEQDGNQALLIPVAIYTVVIVTMSYSAFIRDSSVNGFWTVFTGAVLFVLSDTFLAFNKFIVPIPAAPFFVMSTYGIGQYLITLGILKVTTKEVKTP